jgi:2-iminobutanoate/2-iminopropanoate deaminase
MVLQRSVIATDRAPGAVGPYSQAISIGELVFTAGQIAMNPATGAVEASSIEDQTRQVLANLSAVLEAAGSSLENVVKMTVFMTNLGDFARMNAVYAQHFPHQPPARSAVQVAALPLGVQIEMEAVALIPH